MDGENLEAWRRRPPALSDMASFIDRRIELALNGLPERHDDLTSAVHRLEQHARAVDAWTEWLRSTTGLSADKQAETIEFHLQSDAERLLAARRYEQSVLAGPREELDTDTGGVRAVPDGPEGEIDTSAVYQIHRSSDYVGPATPREQIYPSQLEAAFMSHMRHVTTSGWTTDPIKTVDVITEYGRFTVTITAPEAVET